MDTHVRVYMGAPEKKVPEMGTILCWGLVLGPQSMESPILTQQECRELSQKKGQSIKRLAQATGGTRRV